jgi:thymidylate kinase/thiamine kinase-like enzyme
LDTSSKAKKSINMKKILDTLGYPVSETRQSASDTELRLLFIINRDGSIRWMWPSRLKQPLFLKFYNAQSLKSKLISLMFRLVFMLGLQRILFNKMSLFVSGTIESEDGFNLQSDWALFTGTPGPNNKSIIYTEEHGLGSFIKVACTLRAAGLVETETNILNRLGSLKLQNMTVPEVYNASPGMLRQSDLICNGKRSGKLQPVHINALIELNELTAIKMPMAENGSWQNIKRDLRELTLSNDPRLPKGMIRKLNRLLDETNEYREMEISLCHGDFTPWNLFVQNDLLYAYDWELADPLRPIGFDLFHFIIQQGVLVEHKNWKQIRKDIDQLFSRVSFNQLSKFKEANAEEYLRLYFIYNTVYYLKLYAAQPVWHKQVYWLITAWNDGLSALLSHSVSSRELVLIDAFDFLLNKNYAAMKFQNQYPEKISRFSDVDLCLERPIAKALSTYLARHPLVNGIQKIKRSFMTTLQVFFDDGELLSLDLVWKIKRRQLELMDPQLFLKNATVNEFGVRTPEVLADARYVGLFYTLNNAAIPSKYNHYEELLAKSDTVLDRQLYPCYLDTAFHKKYLLKFIREQKQNKGLKGLHNIINYLADTLKGLTRHSGMVITFSGVDGAGKSTVIEKLKYRLEKQLRRRVVVLRHRPSVLPILSAWTKGKVQAEADSTARLPRQGTNAGFMSSLFRFGYYYADYVIGQFLVYVRYVSRGYVVVYDRYYFDFIHDSKRSNIVLPQGILKAGFSLLLKPKFNFFLYADPTTILSRKKELDEATIARLTGSYLRQFEQLGQSKNASYIPIQNTNLEETLGIVLGNLGRRAA